LKYILKERADIAPNFKAKNLQYLKENIIIPVFTVLDSWSEESGRYFTIIERIPGILLAEV
jgi:hypothetical protein